MEAKLFYLDEYIDKKSTKIKNEKSIGNKKENFELLCEEIERYFDNMWDKEFKSQPEKFLNIQKKAIIGYEGEVNFFIDKIGEYLRNNNKMYEWFPSWYESLTSAVFHENWGLAGIMKWRRMHESSSCKIIGSRIYFLDKGEQVLQVQTISRKRLDKLIRALLLKTPEVRLDEDYAEVYMLDGTRITIYDEGLAKEPVVVFRKYIVARYTFEEQAKRGTIPKESIPLFEDMVAIGFNVNFMGPVRTAKTTFLTTWQSYEKPDLEGILIETDPEIPLHIIMPTAPIMQLVADGEKLKKITRKIMRSDADYIIVAEARDGVALKIAVTATSKGTRRVKSTYHSTTAEDFIYDAANEIVVECGGNVESMIIKVAKAYHYLFEFVQLKDKSKKRLKSIYEVRYNPKDYRISLHQICKYDPMKDSWYWKYDIGEDKGEIAIYEDYDAYQRFKEKLKELEKSNPLIGNNVIIPSYSRC